MKFGVCSKCGKTTFIATHHILSQTEEYKSLYPETINHPDNLIKDVCHGCHSKLPKNREIEHCRHFKIKVKSFTGQLIYNRLDDQYKWSCKDE